MKTTHLIIGSALLLGIAAGGAWWWQSQANTSTNIAAFEATGMIEARQVNVASEVGGQIVEVLVEEGQQVKSGQPLLRLDDALPKVQRAQALAALQAAQANRALLKGGATDEQLNAAEAQLAQAEANLGAVRASFFALTAGARPEEMAAARTNLDRARTDYYTLTGILTTEQVEKVRLALTAAESNLSEAKARKADLEQDTHNPNYTIDAARSGVADAQAAVDTTRQAYQAVTDSEQPYHLQIEKTRLSWSVAEANLAQAQARLEGLTKEARTTEEALNAAESTLTDAGKLLNAAQAAYEALASGASGLELDSAWANVQQAQTVLAAFGASGSVETLLAQIDAAAALRDTAAANLASLKSGARPEQIAAAQAQVDVSQSQLEALDIQLDKFTIMAPWDGVVLTRSAEPGQVALPGGTLFEVGRLDTLELTAYLPEDRLGVTTVGREVGIQVNAYPARTFTGTVLRIADKAEFTPTNVQTKEDRSRLVYAVVISLSNSDLALKPGMIADITLK